MAWFQLVTVTSAAPLRCLPRTRGRPQGAPLRWRSHIHRATRPFAQVHIRVPLAFLSMCDALETLRCNISPFAVASATFNQTLTFNLHPDQPLYPFFPNRRGDMLRQTVERVNRRVRFLPRMPAEAL